MSVLEIHTKYLKGGFAYAVELGADIKRYDGLLGKLGLEKVSIGHSTGADPRFSARQVAEESFDEIAERAGRFYSSCRCTEVHFIGEYSLDKRVKHALKKRMPDVKFAGSFRKFAVGIGVTIDMIRDMYRMHKEEMRREDQYLEEQLKQ